MEQEIYKEKEIANFHIPRWEELPNLDLYVDQVICFLDDALSNYVSKEKEGHVITKSMINNYVKHGVIKSAINKKYPFLLRNTIFIFLAHFIESICRICHLSPI